MGISFHVAILKPIQNTGFNTGPALQALVIGFWRLYIIDKIPIAVSSRLGDGHLSKVCFQTHHTISQT
jgi:hypothetical protein